MASVLLLVPVKAWPRAKSRLRVPEVGSPALAAAFAADAVHAARAARRVAEVVVVTDAEDISFDGVRVLPDRGAGDLNAALRAAARDVRGTDPDRVVAALCADLPCLRSKDLDDALAWADGRRAFVADADGTGTTLLVAAPGTPLDPRFGVGSAERHASSGAVPVVVDVPTLRRDVDTDADLDAAALLGVGRHTARLLDAAGRTAR